MAGGGPQPVFAHLIQVILARIEIAQRAVFFTVEPPRHREDSHTYMKLYPAILAAVLTLLFVPAAAVAGPFDAATAAYQHGDYATAYRLIYPLADQGDATAQFNLGVMYESGDGVPRNAAAALKWYRKAADQGNADAQVNLGLLYAKGVGVPRNYAEASKWFRKAADQGQRDAQFKLGIAYEKGLGVPRNYAEASMWFHKAAEQGNPDAQAVLGLLYLTGLGVTRDYVQAHMWLTLAASRSPPGNDLHDGAIAGRDGVAARMSGAQITEAQRLAREWKPQ